MSGLDGGLSQDVRSSAMGVENILLEAKGKPCVIITLHVSFGSIVVVCHVVRHVMLRSTDILNGTSGGGMSVLSHGPTLMESMNLKKQPRQS